MAKKQLPEFIQKKIDGKKAKDDKKSSAPVKGGEVKPKKASKGSK
jgi:hypothetical protein